MKKVFKTMLVCFVAVVSVAFVGCGKEGDGDSSVNGEGVPAGWVDLGLPSGLLWAECNVGATAPEGYGNYFAWGETTTKDTCNWSTYRYCTVNGEGSLASLTKYNTRTPFGTVDNLTTLEPGDDAATANMGAGARTPTKADWQELMDNTNAVWDTVNGVNGRTFTAANGNSIFIPAAGHRNSSNIVNEGNYGGFWAASLDTVAPVSAWDFSFYSGDQEMNRSNRGLGRSVRAVRAR